MSDVMCSEKRWRGAEAMGAFLLCEDVILMYLKTEVQYVSLNVSAFRIRSTSSVAKRVVKTTRSFIVLWHFASTAKRRRHYMRWSSSRGSRDHSAAKVLIACPLLEVELAIWCHPMLAIGPFRHSYLSFEPCVSFIWSHIYPVCKL